MGCVQVKLPASVIPERPEERSHGDIAYVRYLSRLARLVASHRSVGNRSARATVARSMKTATKVCVCVCGGVVGGVCVGVGGWGGGVVRVCVCVGGGGGCCVGI